VEGNTIVTYGEQVFALLDNDPSLDAPALAEQVGCAPNTARHYVNKWRAARSHDWVHGPLMETQMCDECPHRDECRTLQGLNLNVLCERVCKKDVELAERNGLLDVLEMSRWTDGPTTPSP